jgi:hypothetical protein
MAQTVIGIFETDSLALAARDALVTQQFGRKSIDVATQQSLSGRGDMTDEKNTLNSKAGKFFSNIFPDTNDALRHAAVAQQGAMVIVHVEDMSEAVRAADTLDACGAINVDERARLLEDSLTRQDRTAGYQNDVKVFTGIAENEKSDKPVEGPHIGDRFIANENIRIRSRIVDRPEGDDVRIREQFLEIEPRPDIENQQLNSTNDL